MNTESLERMRQLKLHGMYRAFENLIEARNQHTLSSDEIVRLLLQAEWEERQNKRLFRYIKLARFRYQASVEEVHFNPARNLDKNLFMRLSDCSFIDRKDNILITGPTGAGKSFIAAALGHQACQKGYRVIWFNTEKLFSKLKIARADGTYIKELARIEKTDLLILDDFGLQPLDANKRMSLLEIIEDRHGRKSTIISAQVPVNKWHEIIDEGTIADAILDRLVHSSHRLDLKGESLRKKK